MANINARLSCLQSAFVARGKKAPSDDDLQVWLTYLAEIEDDRIFVNAVMKAAKARNEWFDVGLVLSFAGVELPDHRVEGARRRLADNDGFGFGFGSIFPDAQKQRRPRRLEPEQEQEPAKRDIRRTKGSTT